MAIMNQHNELAYFLGDYGADLNIVTSEGFNLLYFAINIRSLDMVKYLISKNVDLSIRVKGETALHLAALHGDMEIFDYLLSSSMFSLEEPDVVFYIFMMDIRHYALLQCLIRSLLSHIF